MSDSAPRPSQTTMAGGMVIVGSALAVVTAGEQLSSLYSLETRRTVEELLSSTPGSGLDVPGALVLLRIGLMAVAGAATAALVLGVHVLRRSRTARLGLTVLAGPLFFLGLATGGLFTSIVAAAALVLWVQPSRAWLDRTTPPSRPTAPGEPGARSSPLDPPPPDPWAQPSQQPQPPRQSQHPGPVGPSPAGPPPHRGPFGAPAPSMLPPDRAPDRRPDAVVWACVLAWACCGLALVVLGASLTLLLADPSLVWTELERQNPGLLDDSGLDRDTLLRTTYLTLGLGAAWSLAGVVAAVLAFRRSAGGRVALIVSATTAGVLCMVGSITAPLLLAPTLACAACVLLLVRGDARAWFAAQRPRP